ncbi:MAG: hypothetical protein QM767_26870 [Anaeromyxobacter sp.]
MERCCALTLLPLLLASAPAAGRAEGANGEGVLAPYVWLPSLSGTLGAPAGDTGLGDRLDVELPDLEPNLRLGGAMVNLGWRHGRFIAFGDWTYANVRADALTPRDDLYQSVEAQVLGNIVQGFAGYNLLDRGGLRLDLAGGARAYGLKVRLALEQGSLDGRELSDSDLWADAVAAVRADYQWRRWRAYLHADAGAGGSDLTWQALGAVGYAWGWGTLFAGYRHLAVDRTEGNFKLDVALSGPLLGIRLEL